MDKNKFNSSDINDKEIIKQAKYKSSKKLMWYDYLIVLFIPLVYVLITYFIAKFAMSNDKNYWEYFITLGFAISLIVSIATGWLRNKQTASYYNNKTKRYDSTFSEDEGIRRRINKILWLITLVLLICSIIFWIISLV
ncbi:MULTISPECIES: hypothetical protein [Mesoplasma]|uniref:ABC transporter permease n=1 Tax=Mesoplasma florum TaxID=2151 RepID=A0A2R3P6X8_MESFO|nr:MULTISPECIES: hypothetical protein [Mesoplasma]AVN64233.1 hypothetical protein CG003_00930 [Mesoplasma florum]